MPIDVIKIATMSVSANKEETLAFLGFGENACSRLMLACEPVHRVTWKNDRVGWVGRDLP